jgi:alpha-aminoadipate carrier protein LysW
VHVIFSAVLSYNGGEAEIHLEPSAEVGEIIQCPDCGLDLEVLGIDPPALAPAPEEEEDWGE